MKQVVQFLKYSASVLLGLGVVALAPTGTRSAFAQVEPIQLEAHTTVVPLNPDALRRVHRAITAPAVAGSSSSLPMWNYTIVAPKDGNTYSGTMVGGNPFFNGARTVNIPTYVVPLIIIMSDGSRFDPTVADKCSPTLSPLQRLMGSPIFSDHSYTMNGINMGSGQYVDEFQRANFYDTGVSMSGDSYHNPLSPVTVLPAQTINIPSGKGASYNLFGCENVGVVDFSTFDTIITGTLMPNLASQGIGPGVFPLFLMYNVALPSSGDSPSQNCCIIGYHGALANSLNGQIQTYAATDFDTTGYFSNVPDIAPASHEIAEFMNDPYGTNPTPSWGHTGQVSGCQSNLEVGDPLTGVEYTSSGVTMTNGITYYPQQLAFFSWFFGQYPSIGTGGVYSDNGIFTTPAHTCQ